LILWNETLKLLCIILIGELIDFGAEYDAPEDEDGYQFLCYSNKNTSHRRVNKLVWNFTIKKKYCRHISKSISCFGNFKKVVFEGHILRLCENFALMQNNVSFMFRCDSSLNKIVSVCDTHWGNFNKFSKFAKMARVQRVKNPGDFIKINYLSCQNKMHHVLSMKTGHSAIYRNKV
jgi:hypothetical protein